MKKSSLVWLMLALVSTTLLIGCSSKPEESAAPQQSAQPPAQQPQPALKTYMEIRYESGLMSAIMYFEANYDKFTDAERESFADDIVWGVNNRLGVAGWVNSITPDETPAPRTMQLVDSL